MKFTKGQTHFDLGLAVRINQIDKSKKKKIKKIYKNKQ